MAKYRIKGPDGEYDIEAPDHASEADVLSFAQKQFGARKPGAPSTEDIAMANPMKDMSMFDKAAAGVGKAIVDTGTGLKQLAAPVLDAIAPRNRRLSDLITGGDNSRVAELRREVADTRKLDEPLMDTGAGMTGNIAGNIGMMLLPGGALKAAGTVAKAGGAADAANLLSKAGGAVLAPKSISAAVPVGAAMGLAQPSESGAETLMNTGIGAVASGAAPLIVKGARAIGAAAEPFYKAGQDKIIGRVYNKAAGDAAPAARAALDAAQEIVPGSLPTAGQASGNAGIAALERTAAQTVPSVTQAHAERLASQNAARVASLETVAGEPGKREFFAADRRAAADKLYDKAYEKGIDIGRHPETGYFLTKAEIAGRQGEITKLLKRPAIQDAIASARELAANEGEKMTDLAGSVKGLDYVQRALSDKISNATGNEQRILIGLRNRLLKTIDSLSPDYRAARKTFADMSRPINQMDIGERIVNKAVTKDTGQLQSRSFANALTDQGAAKATGFDKTTLANTLEPEQLGRLTAIKDDLARSVFALNAGRGPGSDTVQKLAHSTLLNGAGVPTWLSNWKPAQVGGKIAARIADTLYGGASGGVNQEITTRLAESGLNPKEVARVMRMAAQPGNEKLIEMVSGGGSAIGRTAALALINAQHQ